MSAQLNVNRRKRPSRRAQRGTLGAAMAAAGAGGRSYAYPGMGDHEAHDSRRTFFTGSLSLLFHGGLLALLIYFAGIAPHLDEKLIEVQILKDTPPPPEAPAPAPKALAERRPLNYAPQLQAVAPQVVNPRVVAEASPAVKAEALQMDSVSTSIAPTTIARNTTVVERVSAVNSIVTARAAAVDVSRVGAAAVRGPVKVDTAVGPSVGPRKVTATNVGSTIGTGTLSIGQGSSVREGVVSNRDVLGSPDGAPLVSVNIAVGEGNLRGSGGTGTGLSSGGSASDSKCMARPEVLEYMEQIRERTFQRWKLPPGLAASQQVTLRFRLDAAGSATDVELVRASDNSLGASAIDAMRSASPFPPIPEAARCLAQKRINATFSSESLAG
jgi:TonB family protein